MTEIPSSFAMVGDSEHAVDGLKCRKRDESEGTSSPTN